ncbi:hypothetical protein GCM10010460_04450 [Microbacterium terrae]|nr:hypothetical protein GCM10017594_02040 [Microbacterium terrae]
MAPSRVVGAGATGTAMVGTAVSGRAGRALRRGAGMMAMGVLLGVCSEEAKDAVDAAASHHGAVCTPTQG